MSNSTTNLDLISVSQAQKEVTANALLDAASPAMLYGRRASTSGGLVWGYYGGAVIISGTPTSIANGTITLTASATNYLEADPATGAVTKNTSGWTAGLTPLYSVVCGAATVMSYTDFRSSGGSSGGVSSVNGQSGEVTLTADDVGAEEAGAAAAAVTVHEGASDPHAQYQKESEKGAANGYAGLGSDGKVPAAQLPASATTGGTVTSVALTTPGVLFDVSGSPVTGAGTLAMTLKTQVKNTFLAGPTTGVDAAPTMRAIAAADLPVMGASGSSHAAGIVPDPGSIAGTTKYLREDGSWSVPPGASSGSSTLAGDTDVAISGAADKQVLAYDSASATWKNKALTLTSASMTWSPSDKSGFVTLSNNNMTAAGNSSGWTSVRSTKSQAAGKYYFETTFTGGDQRLYVGLANSAASLSNYIGSDNNGIGFACNGNTFSSSVVLSGATLAVLPNAANGDVICIAADLSSKLLWVRINGGNWNNSASANPATGAGGISFSSMNAGPYFVGASPYTATAIATLNAAGSFAYAIPSGFSAFDTQTSMAFTDTAVNSPTDGQYLKYQASNSKWVNASLLYDFTEFYRGVPGASATVIYRPVPRAVTFPVSLTGSYAKARVAATASTTFSVQKNGSQVGTIVFAAGATSATFTAASAISLAAGDILSIIAPATADATLADIGFTLVGIQ